MRVVPVAIVLSMAVLGRAAIAQKPAQSGAHAGKPSSKVMIPTDIDFVKMSREAVSKSIPLIQKSEAKFREQVGTTCFSCHHQALPAMAIGLARDHGLKVDDAAYASQCKFIYGFTAMAKPLAIAACTDAKAEYQLDHILVDPVATAAYGLAGLDASHWKSDAATAAMAMYLLKKQLPDGHWPVNAARPPLEGSEFTGTALTIRGLAAFLPAEDSAELGAAMNKARTWFTTAHAKTTEDKAFQLFGLAWTHADKSVIDRAAAELLDEQNDDGGWSQMKGIGSDAYATGQVLVALRQAAGLTNHDAAISRGVVFLLGSQHPDGSWLVQKRTIAFQPFFETDFPHDKSQFISIAGTSWASMALTLYAIPAPINISKTASR